MLEMLNAGKSGEPVYPPGTLPNINNRSVRLLIRKANNTMVGVHEFQLFGPGPINYCYDAAYKPKAVLAPNTAVYTGSYDDPLLTIDGDSTNWYSTVYAKFSIDNDRFIQYNFLKDIAPVQWRFKAENQWVPQSEDGIGLHIYRNNRWEDISGVKIPTGWNGSSFFTFNI